MKIAHLILAHSHPEQLEKVIERLHYLEDLYYIHIDAKQDIAPFKRLERFSNVFFIKKRVKVYWGAYSIVQATLNGFEEMIASGKQFDYVNLLSGQDYPLQDICFIHEYLSANYGCLFMQYYSVNEAWQEAIPRITRYHLINYNFPGKHKAERILNAVLPRRKMPDNLIPVGRSQWFTITTAAVTFILYYLEKHPEVTRFFKLTWAPDELIFQTILYNSHFRERMVNNNLRFIDWSEGKASPKIFTMQDLHRLQNSGCLFARKLDMNTDNSLFNAIDNYISIATKV